MADGALDTYLNDHLAGAMFGSNLAEHVHARAEGTPLGELMKSLASEIEEDRQSLVDVMDSVGTVKSVVKQATTWVAEKTSRGKFGGLVGTDHVLGTFMALEAPSLGVEGKQALWTALRAVADRYPALNPAELDRLIERARAQRRILERERMEAAREALQGAA